MWPFRRRRWRSRAPGTLAGATYLQRRRLARQPRVGDGRLPRPTSVLVMAIARSVARRCPLLGRIAAAQPPRVGGLRNQQTKSMGWVFWGIGSRRSTPDSLALGPFIPRPQAPGEGRGMKGPRARESGGGYNEGREVAGA